MGNFLQLCDQVISLYVQAKEWGNWQSCGLKNQKLSHFSINIHLSSQIQSSYAPSQANVVAIVTRLRAGQLGGIIVQYQAGAIVLQTVKPTLQPNKPRSYPVGKQCCIL